jgi:rhamnogalacturonan endolyase
MGSTTRIKRLVVFGVILLVGTGAGAQRQMEKLGRGMVAINEGDGKVYVGWRLLGTDPQDIAFNLYRSTGGREAVKLSDRPITQSTNYADTGVDLSRSNAYFVKPVLKGREQEASASFTLPANAPVKPYISIPLQTPDGCTPNDASVGDLDGDGEYEIVLHQAPRGRDNARRGTTDEPIFEAYKLNGTFLWRINLGKNIREGAHYTQFMVYDLDGDGKAEFACKTADGTVDGKGKTIGDADADYRNADGYILEGPEFLTIFDGQTGAELVTTNYIPPRHPTTQTPTPQQIDEIWGDDRGNRVDRFLACIAYLDGERPSLVMCRGYYTRAVLAAWNWRDGKLTQLWTFDSDDGTPGNEAYRGQGNHNLSVGDVDGDGKDEIVYGACAIDHDGKGLYSTGLGHGDAMHLSDIDPDRPGLEVWGIHERPRHPNGANLRDAATGTVIWGLPLRDPGRGLAMDIDPRHRGYECWASSAGLYNCKGEKISDAKPRSCNMGIWWDGDLLREILDGSSPWFRGGGRGAFIDKWDYVSGTTTRLLDGADYDCVTNNGTKANPCLCADILGDWREEVIWRTRDGKELRIFTTTTLTDRRFYTFMHDPVYRLSVAWQNVAYNQPTQPGFYMGDGMAAPPRPAIRTNGPVAAAQKAPPRRGKVAAKPLFRDPVCDGAADPVLCWNRAEGKWFMFYTNRRANVPNTPGVTWVHGTRIGIAESSDGGASWKYRGTADIDYGQGEYSHWAPEVIEHDSTYHMYLTFVPGIFSNWSHPRDIIHLTSKNLLNWKYESTLKLSSNRSIDACVMRLPDGTWRMWYNNEVDGKSIYYADSPDLYTWQDRGKAMGERAGEGPKVFRWKDRYWMLVDVWRGLGVYRSDDCLNWTRQEENLLEKPGRGADDGVIGRHPDVVVSAGRAYLFYFTHPGRRDSSSKDDTYEQRRSSIQVVELEYENGWLACNRDEPTYILLQPPGEKK